MRISDWSSDVCSSDLSPEPISSAPRAIGEQVACGADEIGSGLFDQGQLSALRHGKAAEAFLDEIAEILLRRAAAQKARQRRLMRSIDRKCVVKGQSVSVS